MRYELFFFFACLCLYAEATFSPYQQRCNTLDSVANRDHNLGFFQCSVGEACFSLDCQPSTLLAALLTHTDFHIFIEPCKIPVAILVNASLLGVKYSHEFTHNETVNLPTPTWFPYTTQLVVMLDNSDSQVLVFSVDLRLNNTDYSIVPKTRFPLNNVTCSNGNLVTHTHENTPTTTPQPATAPCVDTCGAVHKMVSGTNNLCHSTESCLTVLCSSPHIAAFTVDLTSSYTILPCERPPVVEARFDDHNNNKHYTKNITNSSTFGFPFSVPGSPKIHITLEDLDQNSIRFGVDIVVFGFSQPILPAQNIPIDRTHCSWYTGPATNPNCSTTFTPPPHTGSPIHTVTTPIGTHSSETPSQKTPAPHFHSGSPIHTVITPVGTHPSDTPSPKSPQTNNTVRVVVNQVSNPGMIAGVVVATLLATLLVVGLSVGVTLAVVFLFMKKKSKGQYTYSQFRALEEDD